jgi:hypothetical protein
MGEQLPDRSSERTEGGRGARSVVVGPAKLELTAVPASRPGRVRLAVPRRADAAGIDEKGSVWPWPLELEMAVPEDDRPVVLAREQALVVLARLDVEALVVRERRAMDVEDAVDLRPAAAGRKATAVPPATARS